MITGSNETIVPFLWYDQEAEQAARYYVSVFPNSSIDSIAYSPGSAPDEKNRPVFSVTFTLSGRKFYALNGGPKFKFTPAVSFFVHCTTQAEIDTYWEALCRGGREDQCGWLQDRFGLSWQIVPSQLPALLNPPDRDKAQRALAAMLKMRKLEIEALENA